MWFVWFIWSIWFVLLLDPEKPNKPNKRDRPNNGLLTLGVIFSILLEEFRFDQVADLARRVA